MNKKDVPIGIFTLEMDELPEDYGFDGAYATHKRGGLALVIPPLVQGFREILDRPHVYVSAPYVKKAYKKENERRTNRTELKRRMGLTEKYMLFTDSAHIDNLDHIYDEHCPGGHERTLAIYQTKAAPQMKNAFKDSHQRRGIIITNDGAGGYVNEYFKKRNIPSLHMVHNVHTRNVPLDDFFDIQRMNREFFLTRGDPSKVAITETAIKNSDYVGVVGHEYLREITERKLDKFFVGKKDVLDELLVKNNHGQLVALPNGFHKKLLPEFQQHIFQSDVYKEAGALLFDVETPNLTEMKKQNLKAVQRITQGYNRQEWSAGLKEDENAVLYFWPSRLDMYQKGANYIDESAREIMSTYPQAQFLVVADESNEQEGLAGVMKSLCQDFPGRFHYSGFDKDLSDFSYVSCTSVLSVSSFEPFGYFNLQGPAGGSSVVATHLGGAVDILSPFAMNNGNGFFVEGDESNRQKELTKTLHESTKSLIALKKNEQLYSDTMRWWMKDIRSRYSTESMIRNYEPIIDEMALKVMNKPISYFYPKY